jgi:hypothetical protein
MRAKEFLQEGGWVSTATQSTVLNPATVKAALEKINLLVQSYNASQPKEKQIAVGSPLGSTAYYEVDSEDKTYGDIDIQMLAPTVPVATSYSQFAAYWNKELHAYVQATNLPFVYAQDSTPGHPIFKLDEEHYVQVDFMWSSFENKDWTRLRATPEHNLKGLLYGKLFSTLAQLTMTSIGYAGVQQKSVGNEPVPFSKQKGTKLTTITTNPYTFLLDLFNYLAKQQGIAKPQPSNLLKNNPGVSKEEVKAEIIVKGILGLAESFRLNGMYGKGVLERYSNSEEFLTAFKDIYETEANEDINSAKRDKAATPAAIAKAEKDREMVRTGMAKVLGMFK